MRRDLVVLAFVLLLSGCLSVSLMTHGHQWGDDFASYIMQAQSVLCGDMAGFVHHNTISIEQSSYRIGPVAYPWGFPVLLAPLYAAFGPDIYALKLLNPLFFGLLLVVLFLFLRTRLSVLASLSVVAVLGLNPSLLRAHDMVLADIPFLFFSTVGFFLLDRLSAAPRTLAYTFGSGIVLFLAYFVRANGVLLLATLLLLDSLHGWRDVKMLMRVHAPVYGAFAAALAAERFFFPFGQESRVTYFGLLTLPGLFGNAVYYARLPAQLFEGFPGATIVAAVLYGLSVVGLWTRWHRERHIVVYGVLTVALFVLWPAREGLRFLYPLVPFWLYLAFVGTQHVVAAAARRVPSTGLRELRQDSIAAYLWGAGAVASCVVVLAGLRARPPEAGGPSDVGATQMFEFVRENTPADSRIVFFRPRAMRLLTGRDSVMLTDLDALAGGDYVAIHKGIGNRAQIPQEAIENASLAKSLRRIFDNSLFSVYVVDKGTWQRRAEPPLGPLHSAPRPRILLHRLWAMEQACRGVCCLEGVSSELTPDTAHDGLRPQVGIGLWQLRVMALPRRPCLLSETSAVLM